MGTINTGLGGPQGVGENSFIGSTLTSGNLDDGSIQVDITGAFPEGINYFGTNYTSIYINTNGLITFNAPVTTYAPTSIATFNQPAIAVFWSDVDIRAGTATGTNNIYWDIDPTSGRVTITWLNVRAYSGNASNRNTFQVVLDHSQNGNFRIDMIYQQVQWANGGSGIAQVGMTDGGSNDFVVPGSGTTTGVLGLPTGNLDPGQPPGVWSTPFWNGQVVCFEAGTRIATPKGRVPVEALRAGDLVLTRDAGAQPLLWAGGERAIVWGQRLPVCIEPFVFGNTARFAVSPNHLILLSDPLCEVLFGEAEVFAAAQDLLTLPGVWQERKARAVSYHHLLLDGHHVILAEGAATESLMPGPMALQSLPAGSRDALTSSMSSTDLHAIAVRHTARRVLKAHEAQLWCALQGDRRIVAPNTLVRAA